MDTFRWPSICFLAGTLGPGGAERQLFYILRVLHQEGARVWVLCLTQGELWQERIERLGVPVKWVGASRSRAARAWEITRELRLRGAEIIQSQHFYTNLYASAAARFLGQTEIGAIRNDVLHEVRSNGAIMGRMSLRIPRLIAANSRFGLEKAIELGVPSSRLHLLPNVIDTEQFAPGPKTSSERLTILAVGRCVPQKRLDRYLSILGKVRREARIAVRGLVLGDGPLRPHLERQAAELGLAPPTVEFRGNIPDIRNAYREADILLMTSAWEGTPNVVLEAMACGLPVVATDVGGASEIIEHGTTGFLFDPEDEQAAVGLLHDLAGNATLRETIGRRAREHVAANYSLSRLSASLEMLYRSALPRPVSEDERSTR